jgi:DNA integrity scanning protein DisA with diadenylate cyclase activity
MNKHTPNPRIEERSKIGPHLTKHEHVGFNGRLAMLITNMVSTMWCAYLFAIIALISLPAAISGGTATIVSWVAQTFLQLVLLSVIMVGQKVAARASDKQALQTFKDTEALLKIQDEVHRLIKINNELTEEIHSLVKKQKRNKSP